MLHEEGTAFAVPSSWSMFHYNASRCSTSAPLQSPALLLRFAEANLADAAPGPISQNNTDSMFLLSAALTYGLRKSLGAGGATCPSGGYSRISCLPKGMLRQPPHIFQHLPPSICRSLLSLGPTQNVNQSHKLRQDTQKGKSALDR